MLNFLEIEFNVIIKGIGKPMLFSPLNVLSRVHAKNSTGSSVQSVLNLVIRLI
jgi:hypothetical protein